MLVLMIEYRITFTGSNPVSVWGCSYFWLGHVGKLSSRFAWFWYASGTIRQVLMWIDGLLLVVFILLAALLIKLAILDVSIPMVHIFILTIFCGDIVGVPFFFLYISYLESSILQLRESSLSGRTTTLFTQYLTAWTATVGLDNISEHHIGGRSSSIHLTEMYQNLQRIVRLDIVDFCLQQP